MKAIDSLARRGIQPVWLEISNHGDGPLFFDRVHLDPNYYPPREAALVNHFATGKRLAGFGAGLVLPTADCFRAAKVMGCPPRESPDG